jgi:rhodanese-related sulfurtransferase
MSASIPEVDVAGVPAELPEGVTVLDVREDDEWQAGHIEDAVHIPLMQVPARFAAELPIGYRVLVVCRVGGRSAQATSYLQAQGVDAVNLSGGMAAWAIARRAMVAETGATPRVI